MAEGETFDLTADQQASFRDAFEIHDVQQQGFLPFSEIGPLFRACGQNPTDADIKAIVDEYDVHGSHNRLLSPSPQLFDVTTFLRICESPHYKDLMDEEVAVNAFRVFDKEGRGVLSPAQLRMILQALRYKRVLPFQYYGDGLDDELADAFVEYAIAKGDPEKTGEINYELLLKIMIERDPGIQWS